MSENADIMKTIAPAHCGNSPKMALALKLTEAFASYSLDQVAAYLSEDIVWTLVGDAPIAGKENFLAALREMSDNPTQELRIHQVLSHGKEAAIRGEMLMADGNTYGFADFYEFTSAGSERVKRIDSFVISLRN